MTGCRLRRHPCVTSSRGDTQTVQIWWAKARPAPPRPFLPPRPVIHVSRSVKRNLSAGLTALSGYRQARWRVAPPRRLAIGRPGPDDTA